MFVQREWAPDTGLHMPTRSHTLSVEEDKAGGGCGTSESLRVADHAPGDDPRVPGMLTRPVARFVLTLG